MTRNARLVDVDEASFGALPCCGIKSATHTGRREKYCWLQGNFKFGLRAKTLLDPDGEPCGYIEYLPGEFAWRAVEASGYMFIHCLWNHSKRHQHQGCGSAMVEACLNDAKKAGMNGVAVVTREGSWLADRRLFLANGFELVGSAPPDYELLIRKVKASAADPVFKGGWDEKIARHSRGLTIIRSSQCPYIAKFAAEIAETAEQEYGIEARMVHIESWRDAQNAPTPYSVFAVIYKGRLVADHQISRTRFRNIMNKCVT
ncbi:MAG: GNAT family N-acetyltransferase [Candidatus Solibacter sp.]|nr:GNAT family N-acetyltransferase [Candidatus Solibacter sp.]